MLEQRERLALQLLEKAGCRKIIVEAVGKMIDGFFSFLDEQEHVKSAVRAEMIEKAPVDFMSSLASTLAEDMTERELIEAISDPSVYGWVRMMAKGVGYLVPDAMAIIEQHAAAFLPE